MPMLDIFNDDMFSVVSLTMAMEQLPRVPTFVENLGLFRFQGIASTMVIVEERSGLLQIVPAAARGTMPTWMKRERRKARAFTVPHLPVNDTIYADDVMGLRAFGSEDATESVVGMVNDKLQGIKDSLLLTFEWHRLGALRGEVLDADGVTPLYNWFDEFDIVQENIDIDFSSDDILLKALDIRRAITGKLQGAVVTDIVALCGDTFYRNLISNAQVTDAMRDLDDNRFAREIQSDGFEFGNVVWMPVYGTINGNPMIPDDEAIALPRGIRDLFVHFGAPANFMETVNTVGREMYTKQRQLDYDIGVELHGQANPLFACTQPGVLIKLTDVTPPGAMPMMGRRREQEPQEAHPQYQEEYVQPQESQAQPQQS